MPEQLEHLRLPPGERAVSLGAGAAGRAERPQQRAGGVGMRAASQPLELLEGRVASATATSGTVRESARASSRRVRASSNGSCARAKPASASCRQARRRPARWPGRPSPGERGGGPEVGPRCAAGDAVEPPGSPGSRPRGRPARAWTSTSSASSGPAMVDAPTAGTWSSGPAVARSSRSRARAVSPRARWRAASGRTASGCSRVRPAAARPPRVGPDGRAGRPGGSWRPPRLGRWPRSKCRAACDELGLGLAPASGGSEDAAVVGTAERAGDVPPPHEVGGRAHPLFGRGGRR